MENNISKITRLQGKLGLNSLPDDVIVDILSLVPLKLAVKTSVLSVRWRYIWTQINAVDINLQFSDICHNRKYSEILNKVVLKLTSSTIRKLQVTSTPAYDTATPINESTSMFFYNRWFNHICARNVEEVQLKIFGSTIPDLPAYLFESKSLVSLELCRGRFLSCLPRNSDSINLPRLKKLVVQDIHSGGCELTEKLIKSCPSLEDLSLISCKIDRPTPPFSICGRNIKRLLVGLKKLSYHRYGKFMIDTPKLEYLTVNTHYGFSLNSNDLVLLEAHINDYYGLEDGSGLKSARYVRSTMVRPFEIESPSGVGALIKLTYLTRLQLSYEGKFCTEPLLQTLHYCPVLESIDCRLDFISKKDDDNLSGDSPESIVPECLLTHVKKIEIQTQSIHRSILRLIEFFLSKGRVLELLIFKRDYLGRPTKYQYGESKFCKKIYACQRSSSRCQIEFSGYYVTVPKEGGTFMGHIGDNSDKLSPPKNSNVQ